MQKTGTLPMILAAVHFAADRHRNQRRKDAATTTYVNHPVCVAEMLVNVGGIEDPQVICAALLHDTIEDTDTTPDELAEAFGPAVRDIVLEVSDDKSLPKEERKQEQIRHAATASIAAKQVKLADKICNLQDILAHPPADWSDERKRQYFDWAKAVVDQVRGASPALETRFDALYRQGMERFGGK